MSKKSNNCLLLYILCDTGMWSVLNVISSTLHSKTYNLFSLSGETLKSKKLKNLPRFTLPRYAKAAAQIWNSLIPDSCSFQDSGESVQFSGSVMSDSLWPHGLQHTRPPCLSPTPGVYSNSCPLSQWCHPLSSPSPPENRGKWKSPLPHKGKGGVPHYIFWSTQV